MAWSKVKYVCADGRQNNIKDFRDLPIAITDFLDKLREFLPGFFEHHNCAMFMDADWDVVWVSLPHPSPN